MSIADIEVDLDLNNVLLGIVTLTFDLLALPIGLPLMEVDAPFFLPDLVWHVQDDQ